MSIEIEGTPVNRNNRAKEQVLYKVIAEREVEIAKWKSTCEGLNAAILVQAETIETLRTDLRALKSKEYRRSVRRKKQRQVGTQANGETNAE